jgi:penicillin-binding protein 2
MKFPKSADSGKENRHALIMGTVVVVLALFVFRLLSIQILDNEYSELAQQNAIRRVNAYAPRGVIFDRHGRKIVVNRPIYDLMVVPGELPRPIDTVELAALLRINPLELRKRLLKAQTYSMFRPSVLHAQIRIEDFAQIQERLHDFRGIYAETRTVRTYLYPYAAHLLGYVGEASPELIESSKGQYRPGDYVGVSGLEKTYENYLKGKRGVQYRYIDVHNREVGRYKDGAFDSLPIPGEDLHLGLDIELQVYAEKLMANKRGSVVAIEPSTGEILTMVSAPGYDPGLLVGNVRGHNYNKLQQDPLKPLFNRPLQAMYPPGSIVKSLQALVGQELNLIHPQTRFPCGGGYAIAGHTVRCTHKHTALNLEESIQHSCNPYYCYVFRTVVDQNHGLKPREGYRVWYEYMKKFNLGRKCEVDLPNEGKGIVPSPDYYDRVYGRNRWKSSTIISLAIGQGEFGITPLQMAHTMAIFANKGYYHRPHLVRSIGATGQKKMKYREQFHIPIGENNFRVVQDAMQKVVDEGTATAYGKIDSITVCGKTGTAQNPHGKDHAVFVCFAPRDNPRIAVAVLVENAGFGGVWAAPVASLMIEKYLRGQTKRRDLEERLLKARILPEGTDTIPTPTL